MSIDYNELHDFKKFLSLFSLDEAEKIKKFEESYGHFIGYSRPMSFVVGFHFSLEDDESDAYNPVKILEAFPSAVAVYAGTKEMQKRLTDIGISSSWVPYYEDGGFIAVAAFPMKIKS